MSKEGIQEIENFLVGDRVRHGNLRGIEIARSEEGDRLRETLRARIGRFRTGLADLGLAPPVLQIGVARTTARAHGRAVDGFRETGRQDPFDVPAPLAADDLGRDIPPVDADQFRHWMILSERLRPTWSSPVCRYS